MNTSEKSLKIKLNNIEFFYLNLDSRPDKNSRIISHFETNGISATRFSALTAYGPCPVKLPNSYMPGAKGCFSSHYKLISEYDRTCNKILGIFEDDVVLCDDFSDRFAYIEKNFDLDWDIFFLSSFYHLNDDPKRWHNTGDFNFTKIKYIHRVFGSFCTHSYLINPKSIDKILNLMNSHLNKSYAIDHLFILIQPYLNCFSFTPGMTTQVAGISDVDGNKNKDQTVFKNILGEHYYASRLSDFDYDSYFNFKKENTSVSTSVCKFIFKNSAFSYVIFNQDYFNTLYKIEKDKVLNELPDYSQIMSFVNSMNPGKSVVDIGANCGLLSVPCAKSGYVTYAVEPVSSNVKLLELNKRENDCSLLEIVPLAFSNVNEIQKIYVPHCPDNTSFDKKVAICNMSNPNYIEENVQCVTFDDWLKKVDDPNIGFIKIDVQGYEFRVLKGMKKFLNSCEDVFIFLEWDEKITTLAGYSLSEIESFLDSFEFKVVKYLQNDRLYYKGKTLPLAFIRNFKIK